MEITSTTANAVPDIDASLLVTISSDGMEALLDIVPAQGNGAPVSRSAILAALAENGIGEGTLPDVIESALIAGRAERLVIARGTEPEHGTDGYLTSLVKEAGSRVPKIDESGKTDYRDLGDIVVVQANDPIMIRQPATPGKPGKTLFGETIPATPGKDAMFGGRLLGTVISPDNPNQLQAAITGQPIIVRGGMMVEPVYTVNNVNTSTGNITFDGTVVVKGDVQANMVIKATGDIQVGGTVETATLIAGGNIVVKGGVIGSLGRKNSDEHFIFCEGSFRAVYVQQAKIDAGDSIYIDDMVMQSELSAINHIHVGGRKRGHIIGGITQATLSINAKVIGSPHRVKTRCEIGVNPLMHKQLLDMCKIRDARENQLIEVNKLLDFASKNPGKLKPDIIEKANVTAAALTEEIASMVLEQEILTNKIALSQQSRVNVHEIIHDGVVVNMGNQKYLNVTDQGACSITLVRGELAAIGLAEA